MPFPLPEGHDGLVEGAQAWQSEPSWNPGCKLHQLLCSLPAEGSEEMGCEKKKGMCLVGLGARGKEPGQQLEDYKRENINMERSV